MTILFWEKLVFFLYMVLLPFEAFHPLGFNKYGAIAKTPSFFFFIIGFILSIFSQKGKIIIKDRGYLKKLTILIGVVSSISICMAVVLYKSVNPISGFHTIDVIWGPIFYNIIMIFIMYYVIHMTQRVDKIFIDHILDIIYVYTIFIGYIQLGAIFGVGPFRSVLNILGSLDLTYSSRICLNNSQIVLMFSEPSYAEILLCGLLMPFICGRILSTKKSKLSVIKLFLLLPLVFYNGSSSVLIGTAICIGVMLFLSAKKNDKSRKKMIVLFGVYVALVILLFTNNPIKEILINQVLKKPFDQENYSTIQRTSVIRNCLMVFKEHPILGVGNGIQGFFYESHLLPSDLKSYEVLNTLKYENGVPGAGSWAGGWLSGYGIVGTLFLILFIISTLKPLKKFKNTQYYYAYIIGGICFLVCGWFTASTTGGYLSLFVLTIPAFAAKYFTIDESI